MVFTNSLSSYYEKILATGEVKCIDEEVPFEIPHGWEWCRLRNIILGTNAGKSPNCEKRPKKSEEWGVLTTTSIQENAFLSNENKVLPKHYVITPEHCVRYGDILITRAGPVNRTGIVCMVENNCDKLILSDKTVRIDYMHDYCNPKFLVFVLNSSAIHELVMSATVGMAASQVNVSQVSIQNTLIPFPPSKEQQRIIDKLGALLPQIEKYDNAQNKLDELNKTVKDIIKKSVLQEAIQGKLVSQLEEEGTAKELLEQIEAEKQKLVKEGKLKKSGLSDSVIFRGDDNKYFEKIGKTEQDITDEIPFDIPNTWVWVRHNDLFDISGGSQPPKSKFIEREKEGYIRLFQIRDYGSNPQPIYIPLSTASKISQKGDILLARYGASLGKVFYAEYGAYNVALAKVIPLYESRLIFQKYIFLYYCSSIYQNEIVNRSRCAQAGFNKEDLNSLLFPLPPLSEQYRIVEKYEKAIASIMSR